MFFPFSVPEGNACTDDNDDDDSSLQQWQRVPGTSRAKLVLCRKLTVALLELAISQGGGGE